MSRRSGQWVGRLLRAGQRAAIRGGMDIRRYREFPPDFDPATRHIHRQVAEFTLVSPCRTQALCSSIEYLVRHRIPGDIVECGVWKGGSMMAAALTLNRLGASGRDLWLYDTFDGLTAPSGLDVDITGRSALDQMKECHPNLLPSRQGDRVVFACASLEEVRHNMDTVQYRGGEIRFVKGPVEATIPHEIPAEIALLRLDTDFYSSTKHELEHLVPRMAPGSILIVDDYGTWLGARRAVDEFLEGSGIPIYLSRIDETARMAVLGAPGGPGGSGGPGSQAPSLGSE